MGTSRDRLLLLTARPWLIPVYNRHARCHPRQDALAFARVVLAQAQNREPGEAHEPVAAREQSDGAAQACCNPKTPPARKSVSNKTRKQRERMRKLKEAERLRRSKSADVDDDDDDDDDSKRFDDDSKRFDDDY